MPAAVITGASQGLGLATARALAGRGWSLIVDARHAAQLTSAVGGLATVTAIPGDVTDPAHRAAIAASAAVRRNVSKKNRRPPWAFVRLVYNGSFVAL